ncbi:MAG: M23 family metallopeptidase [Candidatus Magasanikbacteria bacterium]|jgi:murein DD-endopeptidase MepM/ murein hydrolase activator NlpD
MKYNLLLKILRFLVHIKRFSWWIGSGLFFVSSEFIGKTYRFFAYFGFKINFYLKKIGIGGEAGLIARDIIQPIIFILLFIVAIPQTKLFTQKNVFLPGQKTLAFNLFGGTEEYEFEEVSAEAPQSNITPTYNWRAGIISADNISNQSEPIIFDQDLAGTYAGGMAINKPHIMTGSITTGGSGRKQTVDYVVVAGDSLSGIASRFGVNVATILWENGLTSKATLKLGQKISIPPASGVMHVVKKGDTLLRIAKVYGAKVEDIVQFNNLDEGGKDLRIGEKIMVPGGVKAEAKVAVTTVKNGKTYVTEQTSYSAVIRPPASSRSASASGFVWPSGVKTITQYFGWKHNGLDIAGPFETPNYAAKAGTVEFAQCGWNRGYGCYVQINHGNGVKTLYGHHSRLLVSAGEYVEAGQVIGLMGNTGNVRGRTGIHLHFEVQVNGVRVNPLGYVR